MHYFSSFRHMDYGYVVLRYLRKFLLEVSCMPNNWIHAMFLIAGLNRQGAHQYNGKNYWLSWRDPQTANTKWDWFNARNYCRKRCMDLVSFETADEYQHFKGIIGGI